MARFAAGGAYLVETGLDLAGDPVLHVKLEAEETTRRNDDGGNQADQYFFHPRNSVCRSQPKCHIVARDGMGV